MRRSLGFLLFLIVLGQSAFSAALPDSTKIYYRAGYRQVDAAYRDNSRNLDSLLMKIRRAMADGDLIRVDVRSQSSPDGELAANERLALNRALAMKEWVVNSTPISADSVNAISEGIAWQALRRMVAASDIPARDEIIDIIDNCPVVSYDDNGNTTGTRLARLINLRDGEPYRIMYNTMFPDLRNSLTANVVTIDPFGVAASTDKAVRLSYRIDETTPDMNRRANRDGYRRIVDEITRRRDSGQPLEVDITCYSAPDATGIDITELGNARVRNLSQSLMYDATAPESIFALYDGGEGWAELRRVIDASSIDNRDEILAIIDGDHSGRLNRLKQHRQGATWAFLCDEIFPMMRNTVTVTVGTPEAVAALREADARINGTPSRALPTIPATSSTKPVATTTDAKAATTATATTTTTPATTTTVDNEVPLTPIYPDTRWAVKTNFLYDAALAPSIEVEYRFNTRWSAALDYEMAWWKNSSKNKIYQVAVISPEARHWFATKKPWHGHYVGLFPGFTWYDLENGGTGHRGHAFFAGVSYGYMFPISRALSIEVGLGVGYMSMRYKDYEPRDGHHVYQRTKSGNYFGPLKARLSLVWRLGTPKATKKAINR